MSKTFFLFLILSLTLAFSVFDVKATPDGWVNPDSHVDDSGKWVNEDKAYDDNTGTCAYAGSYFEESTGYLYLNLDSAITSDKVRYNVVEEYCTDIVIEIGYTNGSWIEIYRSDAWLPANTWKNLTFEEGTVNSTRIIADLHGSLFPMIYSCLYLYEVDFWEIEAGPAEYNFYGVINSQIAVTSQRTWRFDRYSSVNQISSIDSQKSVSFSLFATISQAFSISSLFKHFQTRNFYGAISQVLSASSRITWIFNVQGLIHQVFDIESHTNMPTTASNMHAYILLAFCVFIVYVRRKRKKSLIK